MSFDILGEPVHTRCLAVAFTQGVGDSIIFHADIIDLRKGGLMELAGRIAMSGIIHKMELSGAFSAETGILESIGWAQSHVMHEANQATKGECCRDPMTRLKGLVGSRLGEGFVANLKNHFGGPLGCTHVNTLFQELSAFVARLFEVRRVHPELAELRQLGERISSRSLFFDAFFPEAGDASQLSVRLADLHYATADKDGGEGLFLHEETRLLGEAELVGWQLRDLHAKERSRRGPTCQAEPWTDRTAELESFSGRSLGGGMARFCLERFAEKPEDARLLSSVMSLAPGMTQVGAAVSDSLAPSPLARPSGSGLAGPGPCFMLRSEGPLMKSILTGGESDSSN